MSTVSSTNAAGATEQTAYTPSAGGGSSNSSVAGDTSFEDILAQAVSDMKAGSYNNMAISGAYLGSDMTGQAGLGLGLTGNFPSMMNMGMSDMLEQSIMKASSTGNSDDAMMALLMLMMMMQSGGEGGGEVQMQMMQMMAAMMDKMSAKDAIREDFIYSSGAHPYILDQMDENVFRYKTPAVTNTNEAELPLQWWKPTTPAIVSSEFARSPYLYRAVVDQFNVETAERYRPGREGNTYCNIYVWDVTRAMGAELPLYSDPVTGAPREYPDIKGAANNGARAMDAWLKKYGAQYGWRQVTAEQAQFHANSGRPAVTAAADVGHVQMVVPSKDGKYDPVKGVTIAQAGSKVRNYTYITEIYGSNTLNNKVTYWIHN